MKSKFGRNDESMLERSQKDQAIFVYILDNITLISHLSYDNILEHVIKFKLANFYLPF